MQSVGKQIHNDQNKLLLIKKGNKKAFKFVFEAYYEPIFIFVQNLTKDRFQSEDIVQDSFIKLWNNRSKIDDNTSIKNYLYKIAYNRFIDKYRKNQRKQMLQQEWYFQKIVEISEESNSIKTRKLEKLKREVDLLPPKCREIFVLSKFDGLKYKEISTKLNISIKTVENQIGIAFTKLRKEFKIIKKGNGAKNK